MRNLIQILLAVVVLSSGCDPDGQVTHTYDTGDKYVGEWKDGMPHGQGIKTWDDGRKYLGEWKDGEEYGLGIMTYTIASFTYPAYLNDDGTTYWSLFDNILLGPGTYGVDYDIRIDGEALLYNDKQLVLYAPNDSLMVRPITLKVINLPNKALILCLMEEGLYLPAHLKSP